MDHRQKDPPCWLLRVQWHGFLKAGSGLYKGDNFSTVIRIYWMDENAATKALSSEFPASH